MRKLFKYLLVFLFFFSIQSSDISLLEQAKKTDIGKNLLNFIEAKRVVGDEMADVKKILQQLKNQFDQKYQEAWQNDIDMKKECENQRIALNQRVGNQQKIYNDQKDNQASRKRQMQNLENDQALHLRAIDKTKSELEVEEKKFDSLQNNVDQKNKDIDDAVLAIKEALVLIDTYRIGKSVQEVKESIEKARNLFNLRMDKNKQHLYVSHNQILTRTQVSMNVVDKFYLMNCFIDMRLGLLKEKKYNEENQITSTNELRVLIYKIKDRLKFEEKELAKTKQEILVLKRAIGHFKIVIEQIGIILKESEELLKQTFDNCNRQKEERYLYLKKLKEEENAINGLSLHFDIKIDTSSKYVKEITAEQQQENGSVMKDICINANENDYVVLSCGCRQGQIGKILQYNLSDFGTAPTCTSAKDFSTDPTCSFDFEYRQQTCLGSEFCRFRCRFSSFTNPCQGRQKMCKVNFKCICE